jgi:hypothetical protein
LLSSYLLEAFKWFLTPPLIKGSVPKEVISIYKFEYKIDPIDSENPKIGPLMKFKFVEWRHLFVGVAKVLVD